MDNALHRILMTPCNAAPNKSVEGLGRRFWHNRNQGDGLFEPTLLNELLNKLLIDLLLDRNLIFKLA